MVVLLQLFSLSGILTVFFCGVLMSHYASYNVTESSRITSRQCIRQLFISLKSQLQELLLSESSSLFCRHVFAMLSFIAETFIFLYVGTDALDLTKWKTSSLRYEVVSEYQLERLGCSVKTIHSNLI